MYDSAQAESKEATYPPVQQFGSSMFVFKSFWIIMEFYGTKSGFGYTDNTC